MFTDINFCFDKLSHPELGYPNLAQADLAPDEFDTTWPRVLPVRLFVYFKKYHVDHGVWLVDQAPRHTYYPVGLGWHDFDCDYFALMNHSLLERVRLKEIKVLFYYHEGDNPVRIKKRMDKLLQHYRLPNDAYVFITANSASKKLSNFIYFPDHEPFFSYVNRHQHAPLLSTLERSFDFTVLNRTHKWWRATCMADLKRHGLLEQSLWSYNPLIGINDRWEDNPIEIDTITGLREATQNFCRNDPHVCDTSTPMAHNDHRRVNLDLYHNSYCNIVLETHFDADQSGGSFLTEKTYKCLKFAQPFVIVGPAGSLQALRDRGYRVFDHAIDNSYDKIIDNTQRWLAVRNTIQDLKTRIGPDWLVSCKQDLVWNQDRFQNGQADLICNLVHQLRTLTP